MSYAEKLNRELVDLEVAEASRRMYLTASELETAAGFMSEEDPLAAYLRRRASVLRQSADNLTEGVAEAWGLLS